MGRTEKSQGLAPPAVRKDIRAKQARHIVNRVVPAILASNSRARKGSENSQLIADPKPANVISKIASENSEQPGDDAIYVKRKGQGRRKAKGRGEVDDEAEDYGSMRQSKKHKKKNDSLDEDMSNLTLTSTSPTTSKERSIRIITTDTLTAGHMLTFPSQYTANTDPAPRTNKKQSNVCILNMASPLRPGGGVLSGATSQEEFLCARTTLLPSLKESYYRLPELGGIYTADVLVFRSSLPLGDSNGEVGPAERWWIDVISAGMLRFPELEGEEDEVKTLSKKDRAMVESKMRAVLRIAASKGAKKVVLGAWGCGAYGNPVKDIAEAWRKVLDGGSSVGKKGKVTAALQTWPEIEEVVFAIGNRSMANSFAQAFGGKIDAEAGPTSSAGEEDEEDGDEEDKVTEELRTKIQEMESQLKSVWNPDLKARMGAILTQLQSQLDEREGSRREGNEDEYEEVARDDAEKSSEQDVEDENRQWLQ